jgi:DNA replication and repair protein RecF
VESLDGKIKLDVVVVTTGAGLAGKKFLVNNISRRLSDFAGKLKAVLFRPEDIEIVTGSPSVRRKYMDFVLIQTDGEYRRSLMSYEKGLRQRNKLLERIREGEATRAQLFFWDRLLIKDGGYISHAREELIEFLQQREGLYKIVYDKSIISEHRIAQYEKEEVAAATTLVGPHRDDFWIEETDGDVSTYGSRGEQRMAVMWLKMGERDFLEKKSGELPILILDDVFSELDHKHEDAVLKLTDEQITRGGQVILTTADEHRVPKGKEWRVVKLG